MTETERRALLMTVLARIEAHSFLPTVTGEIYHEGQRLVQWDDVERVLIIMSREPLEES